MAINLRRHSASVSQILVMPAKVVPIHPTMPIHSAARFWLICWIDVRQFVRHLSSFADCLLLDTLTREQDCLCSAGASPTASYESRSGRPSNLGDLIMVNIRSPKETDHRRRHFVATAALTVAAQLGMTNAVVAQPKKAKSL